MRKRKRRQILTAAVMLFISALLCGSNSPVAAGPAVGRLAPASLTAVVEHIRISDKYIEVDAAYPVISGMRDVAFQAEFNRAAQADIKNQIAKLQSEAKESYSEAASKGYVFHKYEFSSAVEKYLNNGQLLSIAIRMDIYASGAHPFLDSRFYVLSNSIPARQLALPGLFVDSAAGMFRLNELIRERMAANPGEYFDGPAASTDAKTWYYLTDTELHVVFPAYSIAPGVAGEPDFGFGLSSFKNTLIPDITN